MARLKEYNGHYCESEYEYAFIGFLEAEGWKYSSGNNISRVTKRDVLIADDFKKFIADTNPDLTEDEVIQIYDNVRLVGAESDFATLHKVYGWMVNGVQFTTQDGLPRMIPLIDFDNWDKNIFRVVNQFTVEYTNNGQKENRRPDVLLFVNGMPLCVIELKNPADANATIYDAWEQINIRYWRDIPHLLHYCPLACISDGVKTRLGTVRTPYEHFYAWRRVNEGDAVSTLPFAETETMIKGVYAPERFMEIFRDYIYFQDSIYDSDEVEIICRYPQFFAAKLLKQSIVNSVVTRSGKGGTYFGATGCGKTYTMAFLARQLALRCTDIPEIGSPTIILIVDRDELQKQGSKLFTKSKEFLNLGEVSVVKNRTQLRQELGARQSGGFYICTIQKFCDRKDDKIGLINDRQNIICFSDEAHRTQLEHSKKIQFSKDADENMKAMVSKPYAKVLKEAFPHATFVGFTGTPIAETYQTFGDEIDRYTMDQAVADGLTVSIKYHPRIAKVLLDNKKVSQMNVIPDTELSLVDFEEAAYAKNGIGVETKIRDIGQLEIDRFQLGWHMSQIVMNNRVRKKYVTREEKVRRQNESDSILRFFQGGKALEYSSNWINAMYYFMLTSDTNRYAWKQFQGNIIDAIKQIKVSDIEDVKRNKKRRISSKLKKDLALHFDICISTVLALNIQYCRKEKKTVLALAKKMRKANLFNHHLVSYPLVNYSDDIDENCDLTNILPEQIHSMNLLIRDSKKSKLSPRFINLDEIYQYVFLRKFYNGGNYYGDEDNTVVKKKLEFIENYFYEVNQINRGTASHLAITIKNEMHNEYILQKIELGNKCAVKEKIKIAIANIKLDTKRCCLGLACGDDVEIDRLRLIDFMYRAYANGKNDKVDFLVFPEFYMPLQWISDVLAFVRKSGITVVSGLQYVTSGHQAYNNVAIFAPVNTGRYTSSVLFAREKNDYAPMERQILALEKYICVDQEKPVYQMINNRGIDYGLFLCYEFTDIIARALYKDKVDIIFTPEHNRDTSYFSNIIETTARDLHVFIVQANTSIYGDSRITGPFGRNDRNVLQIKGGDKDDIIIGTIELGKVKKYQQDEKVDFDNKIQEYLKYNRKQKYEEEQKLFKEQKIKIAKTSARFGGNK